MTSTFEDTHPVAKRTLSLEKEPSASLGSVPLHKGTHAPPCNLLIVTCFPDQVCPHTEWVDHA